MMSAHKEKQPQQELVVASLASESHLPIDDVARLYEQQQGELAAGARVTNFVHIFATRNVQEILRVRSRGSRAAAAGEAVLNPLLATASLRPT
jgi:hypothetical protein